MQYINPIEILGLSNATDITSIDNETIKKAKRKLFADIDLSDNGFFEYHGLQLTKSDCEKAIDELSSNELKEFYLYLCKNDKLNAFLVNGNNEVFENFKKDKIFQKLEFVKFISPYFAPKFDKALLEAFENEIEIETKAILKTSLLITRDDLNIAFRSVTNFLNNGIEEVENITDEIKNEESNYTDDTISDVLDIVKYNFPSKTINLLPNYFQSQISKIASSINYLSNSIWDEFDSIQVSNDLTAYLLTLNIGGLDRPTFEKNFEVINKANTERIEQAKNAPLLKKWADILLQLNIYTEKVKDKSLSSNLAYEQTKDLIPLIELNSLPSFADDIRTQIGYSIRNLSIALWNNENDIKNSINIINLALQINVENDDKVKFKQDLIEFQELENKYKGILICYFCDKNSPDDNSSLEKEIYRETYRGYFPPSVQFSQSTISIPRCKSCEEVHTKGKNQYSIYFFGFLILGFVIGVITEGHHFIIGGIIGSVVGWIVGKFVRNSAVGKHGIKDSSESNLKKHPILIERMKQGWTLSVPTP